MKTPPSPSATNQEWFEMADVLKKKIDAAVWIPLRAFDETAIGKRGYVGYKSELFAVSSIAVPLEKRKEAEALQWRDLNMSHHKGGFEHERYVPADVFEDTRIGQAVPLVIDQSGCGSDPTVWHLHQDLVVTLELKREGNVWVAMNEGYVEVARLSNRSDGSPSRLEIRAEHLKDYLCARGMALCVSSFRLREEVVENASHVIWTDNPIRRDNLRDRWEGRLTEIHEGGEPFGTGWSITQITRVNVDFDEDVPQIGPDDPSEFKSWTKKSEGRRLHDVRGELWRTEWVEPAKHSPRVRGDELPSSVFFIMDGSGVKKSAESLRAGHRWLWFQPGVIPALADRRGGALQWHTRDTGSVICSPAQGGVVFGVNKLGLVNAYAKDIGYLPEWQQRIWAGFNVGPEGGVSAELLASQAQGIPAATQAPERFLPKAIESLNEITTHKFGFRLFREHEQFHAVLLRTHRFRSLDNAGLLSLAKDLARLIADSIDKTGLQKIVPPPKDKDWGSLKSLENVIAQQIDPINAHTLLGPLHGVYNLRLGDAHLPGAEMQNAFKLAGIDQALPFVVQGCQLLHSCVSCLYAIAESLKQFADKNPSTVPATRA